MGRADDPGVIWSQDAHWHPRLPEPPKGFPWEASFALTHVEADFLRGRMEESCAGTLLAWLARNGCAAPAEAPWDDPDALRAPASVREPLELARRFSLHVEGMPLLYNLVVAERRREVLDSDEAESIEEFRGDLAEWATREADERTYQPDALWELVTRRGGRLPYSQRLFVESWSQRIAELEPDEVADDDRLRDAGCRPRAAPQGRPGTAGQPEPPRGLEPRGRRRPNGLPLVPCPAVPDRPASRTRRLMLLPDARKTAFELIRPPSGYRLDFAVLTTYTLDLEALLVLPLSVLAHPDGGLEELLADPLGLHQAIREAGERVHAFVDETGIGIPRRARPLYSMLESSVHAVRAPHGGAFHPKVWGGPIRRGGRNGGGSNHGRPPADGGAVAEPDLRPLLGRGPGQRGPRFEAGGAWPRAGRSPISSGRCRN